MSIPTLRKSIKTTLIKTSDVRGFNMSGNFFNDEGNEIILLSNGIFHDSGAPAARRTAKRSPILIWETKGNPVGAYARRRRRRRRSHATWRPYSKQWVDRDMQPWFTLHFFDIGHPCYDKLTPVKTSHPLTSIT